MAIFAFFMQRLFLEKLTQTGKRGVSGKKN